MQSVLTDPQKAALRGKRTAQSFDRMKTTYASPDLKLTDDQTSKINAIVEEAKKEAAAAATSSDPQADRQKMRDLMRATRDKLDAVLTPEQKKQIPQFGGGRNGGNRGNRGNGQGGNNPPTPPGGNPPAKTPPAAI